MKLSKNRLPWLDQLRGMAVILMIVFHFSYDLRLFGLVQLNFDEGFWYAFPRFIAGFFLFLVGVSIEEASSSSTFTAKFFSRLKTLIGLSLLISLVTYLTNPDQWIYFGTLHCIALSSLIVFYLRRNKFLSLFVMCSILFLQYYLDFDIKWVSALIQKPSMDFIPTYPWLWVVILGQQLHPWLKRWLKDLDILHFSWPAKLGQNSLWIYMIHQPILFGLIWLVSKVK